MNDTSKNLEGELEDERHNCQNNGVTVENRTIMQFLWAIAHIGEAVYFSSVLLFVPEGESKPSLELIGESLDGFDQKVASGVDVSFFVNTVRESANIVTSLAESKEGEESMLLALLKNLTTAQKAIADIESLPEQISESIDQSLNSVNTLSKVFADSNVTTEVDLLKGLQHDLAKDAVESIYENLDDNTFQELEVEQQQEVCNQLAIMAGVETPSQIPDEFKPASLKGAADPCRDF
jgi:hypothetical protein